MMIERHVTFHVIPGKKSEFIRFFKDKYHPALTNSDGFIAGDVYQVVEDENDLMMILRFESFESAKTWRCSARHQDLKPDLKALYHGSDLLVLVPIDKR